jgi:hypothetical protein
MGTGVNAFDYCFLPPVSAPVAAPVRAPVAAPVPSPVAAPVAPPVPSLVVVGDEGIPSSAFPLQRCQGDCDSGKFYLV